MMTMKKSKKKLNKNNVNNNIELEKPINDLILKEKEHILESDKIIKKHKVNEFIKNPINISNVLTIVLIIVTISSIIATVQITKVSLELDKQRQKELIISKIDYVDKLILELKENKGKLDIINKSIESYRDNIDGPIDTISTIRLENSFDIINNKTLIQELNAYNTGFKIIKSNLNEINDAILANNMIGKNNSLDKLKKNIQGELNGIRNFDNYVIYGIPDLIQKLESYKVNLEKELIELNKK